MKKEPSFGTPPGVWTYFLFFLEKKTKSIRLCSKFYVKAATILLSKCTSLLLRIKPVHQNWRHLLKSFRKGARSKG